jgi:DNA polymerase-1
MLRVEDLLSKSYPGASLILQIHDELLIEAPDHGDAENKKLIEDVKLAMENVMDLSVPLKVDTGSGYSWQEAQS